MIQDPEHYLITAGGKIRCRRCKAQSSRTKLQCSKPALKGKSVCQFHGGRSTGPKTKEGKRRIRDAHWVHGEATLEARQNHREASARIAMLEQLGWHLKMFRGNKTRGRKPAGYIKLNLNEADQIYIALLASLGVKF